ncbi:hypothetical protein BDN67DRAFT_1014798 [Paxillus ammoniavirescens]|nr:hypothetical protein BDN67DRAFT_1014798 [Paxillus ammoniavirescens]
MVYEYPYGTTTKPTLEPIKLLYIPDLSRVFHTGLDVGSNLGWVRRYLTAEELFAIRGLQSFQRKVKARVGERSPGTTTILLTEWLWGMLCLSAHRINWAKIFKVSYMLWEDFKVVMIDPRGPGTREKWDSIRSQDCIIGGIDYTINTTCIIPHVSVCSSSACDFTTLPTLCISFMFWPPVPSMCMATQKWNMVGVLDFIAKENGWCRPDTR